MAESLESFKKFIGKSETATDVVGKRSSGSDVGG